MSVSRTEYEPIPALVSTTDETGYLAQFCAMSTRDSYYVRNIDTGTWASQLSMKAATHLLTEQHARPAPVQFGGQKLLIDREAITAFLKRDVRVADGAVLIPNGPAAAIVRGKRLINVFNERDILTPDPLVLASNSATRRQLFFFLRIIRESLCAKPGQKPYEEMMGVLAGDDPAELEFRFVMHWLAAIQQSPGVNLQTNIWFLGELGGIGKGTLERILALMYGPLLGAANQTEVEAGWTDHFANHLIMVVDEFRDNRHFAWGPFIKRETTNHLVSLRKRHEGTITTLNTMNWPFFSNNECPMRFDDIDRRNFLVATTSDKSWTEPVRQFHQWLTEYPSAAKQLAAGFAHILSQVKVDHALIARAPDTPLRAENRESNKNAVQCWLEDASYPRNEWVDTGKLFESYRQWRSDNAEDSAIRSQNAFSRHLRAMARKSGGAIERDGDKRVSWKIDGDKYPAPPQPKKPPTAAELMEGIRSRMGSNRQGECNHQVA